MTYVGHGSHDVAPGSMDMCPGAQIEHCLGVESVFKKVPGRHSSNLVVDDVVGDGVRDRVGDMGGSGVGGGAASLA